jgi:hypothetical protein
LQILDLKTYRRLRQIHSLCGPSEVALSGDSGSGNYNSSGLGESCSILDMLLAIAPNPQIRLLGMADEVLHDAQS